MSPAEFHFFPLLPKEIRLAIWELCIPQNTTLLPRTDTADACRQVCRESRAVHTKTYALLFRPLAKKLYKRPISLYANVRAGMDDTLYVDDVEILRCDFKDWIVPGLKHHITHLAIDDAVWRMRGPSRGDAVLESRGDARFMMFHPESGLSGLNVLTIVRSPQDPSLDRQVCPGSRHNLDDRRLVKTVWPGENDKKDAEQVMHVFKTLNTLEKLGLYAGWKEPELRFSYVGFSNDDK
ncbi:hypothetical protein QTJ16_003749 [Diplocarpon rosae]|uniref:2EXR domain-containing protein n=1 Tax=Diplocarpon rosae TaxID=946125 RepID=A0AAD9T0Y8_9HELO|nr:hypothetical protein QTJ16_003749 [Diplocarpon rosae]